MQQLKQQSEHQRVRVKVCGMTRPEDARAAVELGVDAIGMILHADSPRAISIEQAQAIRAQVPAFVSLVGVFVDCPAPKLEDYASSIDLDLIQLHGAESNDFGLALKLPFIKAIRAKNEAQVSKAISEYPSARALLLDPYVPGKHGGTGQSLSDHLWPDTEKDLILAGGLSPSNIARAVKALKPFAVDLNSGVETAPGIKSSMQIASALNQLNSIKES